LRCKRIPGPSDGIEPSRSARYQDRVAGFGTLIVERDGRALLQVRLERSRTILGSHPTSDVVLPSDDLSPAALVVRDTGTAFRVRRLDPSISLPGGVDDDEVEIEPGAAIPLGDHAIRLQRGPLPPRSPDNTRRLGPERPSDLPPALTLEGPGIQRSLSPAVPYTIGTDPTNDLALDDPFVSSFHCRLEPRRGTWAVVDLGSTNGTRLDGLQVGEAELPPEAEIRVGETVLRTRRRRDPAPEAPEAVPGMLGRSRVMQEVFDRVPRLAGSTEPVLVTGESGTGKELVARGLHEASGRSGPFLALNCGALSATLVESELFGHVKGAFTGAIADRKGAFEATRGGTLFLDEVGELPLELQPKLLRTLETRTVRPVGGTAEVPVDVRIIAATHRNLDAQVRRGEFREDLFHRLFVLSVRIPSLRDRPEDIVPLAQHFLREQPGDHALTPAAELRLRQHRWPGNVRELRNAIIRAIYAAPRGVIEAHHIEFSTTAFAASAPDARRDANLDEQHQRERMIAALAESGGNRSEAARILGVSKSTFFDRLRRFGIEGES
jgi:DNA-binding NtrC family response regulator